MLLQRKNGWRSSMEKNLQEARRKEFKWGEHDCALFAAKHVKAITDIDFSTPFVDTYSDCEGALVALSKNGYSDLLDLCQKNFEEIPPSLAKIGDLLVIETKESGYAISIVLGETIGVLTPKGYGILRRTDKRIKTGFRIG